MARVLDLTPKRSPTVEISAGTAYELLVSLTILAENPDDWSAYEVGSQWFEDVRSRMSADLRAALDKVPGHQMHAWVHLFGLAYELPEPRDAQSLIRKLEETSGLELRLHMLGYYQRPDIRGLSREVVRAAAEGDVSAGKQVAQAWHEHHTGAGKSAEEGAGALSSFVAQPTEETKARLLAVMRLWYDEVFRREEGTILPILMRDAASKRELAHTMTPERLTELATNGLQYSGEPGISKVLLIPSYLFRPWSMISEYRDAKVFIHGVADESLEAETDAPPTHLMRLVEALADEKRLRILRRVATQPCTMHQLAEYLDLAKSTVHHHLAILRAAGLLRSPAGTKAYTLRSEALKEIPGLLDAYVGDAETTQEAEAAARRG